MEAAQEAYLKALEEHGAEFQFSREGWFDRFVNGLNRLPRPFLAFGTIGLFVHAMADPEGFARRMVGLNQVPEPLWWLLAAIVGFYFGAREAHYLRGPRRAAPQGKAPAATRGAVADTNPALAEWRGRGGPLTSSASSLFKYPRGADGPPPRRGEHVTATLARSPLARPAGASMLRP